MMIVSIGLVAQPWQAFSSRCSARQHRRIELSQRADAGRSGLPGYEAGSWYGLFAPAGTPSAIVEKINAETQRIFTDPAFRDRVLAPSFIYSIASSPEQFTTRIRSDSAKWGKVIREANIKAE